MFLNRRNKEDIGFSFTPKSDDGLDANYKNKIFPSPFEVKEFYDQPIVDYRNINSDYALFNIKNLYHILPKMGKVASNVFMVIAYNLEVDTNLVKFSPSDYRNKNKKSIGVLQYGLNELVTLNIVAPTANRFHFIINHNVCYKGDLNKFSKIYRELYNENEFTYNVKGKLKINV